MHLWKFLIGAEPLVIDGFDYRNRLAIVLAPDPETARAMAKEHQVERDLEAFPAEHPMTTAEARDIAMENTIWLDHVEPVRLPIDKAAVLTVVLAD